MHRASSLQQLIVSIKDYHSDNVPDRFNKLRPLYLFPCGGTNRKLDLILQICIGRYLP